MYRQINRFVHSYDFKYSDFLDPYIDIILQNFEENKHNLSKDCILSIPSVNEFISDNLNRIIQENYYAGPILGDYPPNVYVQYPNVPEEEQSFYHNHVHTIGNIAGVFYLNLPNEGGEFQVHNPPFIEHHRFKPEIDKVYFFPIWLMHKACPHMENLKRICINWAYAGNVRAVHKLTGNVW